MATTNFTLLVHNRPRLTLHCLESLARSGMQDMHVTILDDASNEKTNWEVWKWCQLRPDVHMTRLNDSHGTGYARNRVIQESERIAGRRNYLYLSDNDVFFYPSWLNILTRCYDVAWDWGFRAIGAYNHPFHIPFGDPVVIGMYQVQQVHALALQSMIMKWEVWDKYGPFCATPPGMVCQSEDVDFANKLTADGFKLGVVNPALLVNTGITNSFGNKIPGWELVQKQCPKGVVCE